MVQLSRKLKEKIGSFYHRKTRKETLTSNVFAVVMLKEYSKVTERNILVDNFEFNFI
jgi:hypothetical protein